MGKKKKHNITENPDYYPHLASTKGETRAEFAIRILSNSKIDVTHIAEHGETMIMGCIADHASTENNRIATAELMLDTKLIDIEDRDHAGNTVLTHCAMHGTRRIAQFFVSRGGADINTKNKMGATPLHMALLANNYDIANYLIDSGADINAKSDDGSSILMEAIRCVVDQKEEGLDPDLSKPLGIVAKLLEFNHVNVDHIYQNHSALKIAKSLGLTDVENMISDFLDRRSSTKEGKLLDKTTKLSKLLNALEKAQAQNNEDALSHDLIFDGVFSAIQLSENTVLRTVLENTQIVAQIFAFEDRDEVIKKWRSAANPSKKKKQLQKTIDTLSATITEIDSNLKEETVLEPETQTVPDELLYDADSESVTSQPSATAQYEETSVEAGFDMWHSGEELLNILGELRKPDATIKPNNTETQNMVNTTKGRS